MDNVFTSIITKSITIYLPTEVPKNKNDFPPIYTPNYSSLLKKINIFIRSTNDPLIVLDYLSNNIS